jgi:hypothetical protein
MASTSTSSPGSPLSDRQAEDGSQSTNAMSSQGDDVSSQSTNDESPPGSPIFDDEVDIDVRSQFKDLLSAIDDVQHWERGHDEIRAAYEALNERVQVKVTNKPILSRIVSRNLLNWNLLMSVCTKLHEWSHPTIKFLIKANPHALLWGASDAGLDAEGMLIYEIADHHSHCILMPWIAERYPWVLDHKRCRERPPALNLIVHYADEPEQCTADIVRHFFEAYPRGLSQEDEGMEEGFPIHKVACGCYGCEPDLFIWMVEKCPESAFKIDRFGHNPLHKACFSLRYGLREICEFMITNFSGTVRTLGVSGDLPVHWLIGRCHNEQVLEAAMLLLNEYPESYDISSNIKGSTVAPKHDPFIQHAYLRQTKQAFEVAVENTQDPLIRSTCDTFASWAASHLRELETLMEQISNERANYYEQDWDTDDWYSDDDED